MRIVLSILVFMLSALSFAAAQNPTPGYHLIFGNPDGSTFYAPLDADIEVALWGATPAVGSGYEDLDGNGIVDSINFFQINVITYDIYIPVRYPPFPHYPFTDWDEIAIQTENASGTTRQTILAIADFGGPTNPLFNTNGDTVHIFTLPMRTTDNPDYLYQEVCPFVDSPFYPPLLGFQDGVTAIVPSETYSCMILVDYVPGDANGSGTLNGLDVNYLTNYFAGFGPPPDPLLAGDANGDCLTNLMDVLYLVAYFKEIGPPPFYGDCY